MKVNIVDIGIDKITKKEALLKVRKFLKSGRHYLVTVYSEMIVAAQKDQKFKEILNKADLAVADGIGILWAAEVSQISNLKSRASKIFRSILYLFCIIFWSRKIKTVLPERIAGVDLVEDVCGLAAEKKHAVFFLGGKEGIAKAASENLKKKFPSLKIAGYFSGRKEKKGDKVLRGIINQKKPDILFVAFGPPHQEKWIFRNLLHLSSVKLAIGVGGSFDYIAGLKKRAPKIFQKLGLEWFWRLLKDPKRWRRIINAVIIFPYIVIKSKINER